ncbi:MAG: tetratricopeptide repeat protein [Thermodesulfobacteria bacterium]|nr:tetratricopeptide repeat protein [Thermodesulfobacteriota bacterium]
MKLKDSYKESGQAYDKVRTPEETLNWALERFSSLGQPVLEEVKRIDKGRLGIPVFVSRYSPQASAITGTKKQMGKGVTEAQAKASAIMEIAERYSLFRFVKGHQFVVKPYRDVQGDKFDLAHFLKAVHHDSALNEKEEELLVTFPNQWTEGLRALGEAQCSVPFSWMWPIFEYNGSAAGNSLAEAAVQAICEVVERHVCSVISFKRLSTPTIDISSVEDEGLAQLIDKFRSKNIELVLKDFSLDIGIPTVGAIAWDPSTYPERSEIVYTAGTSTSPVRAAIRAITEVAQLAGDFDTEGRYLESGLPKFATLEEAKYVLDAPETVKLNQLPDCSSSNFRQEVHLLATALDEAGLPVYLTDITDQELGIPAVYAMVPGSHFRDRTLNIDLPFHMARIASTGGFLGPFEALDVLSRLDEVYPNRFDIVFYMGHILESLGDLEGAIEKYKAALSLSPPENELASLHCNLGNCLRQLGRLDEAVKELEAARALAPDLKEIHNILGTCLYQMGRYTDAIESFERAIAIDPGSAIDYANIASNLRKLGIIPAAIQWYKMALELDPTIDWAREHLSAIESEMVNG